MATVADLFTGLPPDARSNTPDGSWPVQIELLAVIAEVLHALYRAQLATGGVKEINLPKPLSVPRPRDLIPRQRARSLADVQNVITAAWGG